MFRIFKAAIPLALLFLLEAAPVFAQQPVYNLINRWRETAIGVVGPSAVEQPNSGVADNQWYLEAGEGNAVLFRSAVTNDYLQFNGDALSVGPIAPGAREAMWQLERVDAGFWRIANVARPDIYLHTQQLFLEASPMQPNWWSAMWKVDQINVPVMARRSTSVGQSGNTGQQVQGGLQNQTPSQNAYGQVPPPPASGNRATPTANQPTGATVRLYIQNRSNADLDVFVDDDNGEQVFLATLQPNQQLQQDSPVGLVWRLAQANNWQSVYQIEPGSAEQVIVFPQ